MKYILTCLLYFFVIAFAYSQQEEEPEAYKKRVLETTEVDFLSSYYEQEGENAVVSGGIGNEELIDATATVIVSIPLNDDDVLTINAGISAYTSASSSNIDPFDHNVADPFVASSGESSADLWSNITASYSHSSDDRNKIWNANASFSNEYDYTSIGFGAGYTYLFNEKNTEISINASAYFDTWSLIYPIELRAPGSGDDEDDDFNINNYTITGNPNYAPAFQPLLDGSRNSYSVGLGFSQILSKKLQGSLAADFILQDGLLSTPFQRVYFADVENSFIENFHLADDIERLPSSRFKVALGGRLNYYLNEWVTARTFYRYYFDDWGVQSHTFKLELPIKVSSKFTLYPSYRFYNQTAADYFKPYDQALSTDAFYTSDFDLSQYSSNQFGFGFSYTDIFSKTHIWKLGLKSIDLKFYKYDRNTTFGSYIFTTGFKFVLD